MKYVFAAIALIAPTATWADTFYANLPVTSATVYPQGAMITREIKLNVPAGQHQVILAVHPNATAAGFPELSVTGAVALSTGFSNSMGADPELFFSDDQFAARSAYRAQKAKQEALLRDLEAIKSDLEALSTQAGFLKQIAPSTDAPQSFEDLQAISAFLPTAMMENAKLRGTLRAEVSTLQETIAKETERLKTLSTLLEHANLPDRSWPLATLTIQAPSATSLTIAGESFANSAGWEMSYDLNLIEARNTIEVERAANISQNTGENWRDVDVTLSSANPSQRLNPNVPRRDVVQLIVPAEKAYSRSSADSLGMAEPAMEPMVVVQAVEHAMAPPPVSGSFDGVAVEYTVPNPVTLISYFSTSEQIDMPPLTLDAEVDRYASPRRDKTAFVRAIVTNTTGEPMLSGGATFYREGNLIRYARLNLIPVGGEATLHFGPDLSLPLDMRFLSEMSGDTGFITRTNTRQEQMEFEVKNIGSAEQVVTVAYALPISVEEDVQVRLNARPGPTREDVDGVQGLSEWDITLPPGGTQIFKLDVNITWPDGAEISWRP